MSLTVSAASLLLMAGAVGPALAEAKPPRFEPSTVRLVSEQVTSIGLPVLTAPQAIALLNRQRAANGIPGDLVEEPTLSSGCLSWATNYREAEGQYPHEELPSQPGYTAEGNEAAASSDLDGEPGSEATVGTLWGPLFNPWSGAAIHQAGLMNPGATAAWYGATADAACMGTGGSRSFTTPAFYSVPGPGAANVPIAENTGEEPYSPQQAAGLSTGYSAPAIILFAEGTDAKLQSATLTSSAGATVPTRDITPESSAPPSAPGFAPSATFGYIASYVVPRTKFEADTSYVLSAVWQNGEGATTTQTVSFETAATDLNGQIAAYEREVAKPAARSGVPLGAITPTLHGRRLSIKASGVGIGRSIRIRVERCPTKRCRPGEVQIPWRVTVTLSTPITNIRLPRLATGFRSVLTVYTPAFTTGGDRVGEQVTGADLPGQAFR